MFLHSKKALGLSAGIYIIYVQKTRGVLNRITVSMGWQEIIRDILAKLQRSDDVTDDR